MEIITNGSDFLRMFSRIFTVYTPVSNRASTGLNNCLEVILENDLAGLIDDEACPCFPLTNRHDLVLHRSVRRRFINPCQTLVVEIWKKRGQQSVTTRRVGGQPHVHSSNRTPRVLEITHQMRG